MKFGLENISRLCAALGHPERAFHSIIVAGTNGKGSVTAMVHRALVAAGHRAGRYTSPHLQRIEERYVIGMDDVETARLADAAGDVRAAIERLQRDGSLDAPPTFFECATAIAFQLFRDAGIGVAVLEVGLGGRLDATNVVSPVAAAITSIDFDHQAQLGHTLESIAFEKAGVIKPGIPVVCGDVPAEAERVIAAACSAQRARLVQASGCVDLDAIVAAAPLSLPGAHQRANAAVAACLLKEVDALGIRVDTAAIRVGLTDVAWPGRLERVRYQGADVLLDAAHNPAGARALAAYIAESGWKGAALVFGAMHDKDVAAMLAALASVCAAIICTRADAPRAMSAEALSAIAGGVPGAAWAVSTIPDPASALAFATGRFPRVVVAGSIFLVGPVRGILRRR
jgi:dihydrofolate synthase / folylpolyglutamate synthase